MRALLVLGCLTAVAVAGSSQERGKDIAQTAADAGSFQTLLGALKKTGLDEALSGDGPFTVFAPTDDAFGRLGKIDLTKERLAGVLKFHVVKGRLSATDLIKRGAVTTLEGQALTLGIDGGRLTVNGTPIVRNDIRCRNGVIHVIDGVLFPPRGAGVVTVFERAIELGVPRFNKGQHDACAALYELGIRAVLSLGMDELDEEQRSTLERALRSKSPSATDRAWTLRLAMDTVIQELERTEKRKDEIILEAPLPAGFPKPGPVGEVVLKSYPRYRAARAEGGMFAFGTLFNHIKKNKIEMTAPVEMAVDDRGSRLNIRNMAFLYADPALGKAGRDGRVDVVDLEPKRMLSLGLLGARSPAAMTAAKKQVEDELKRRGLKRVGDWRLMGYNSPMVPAERRYWELQIEVE